MKPLLVLLVLAACSSSKPNKHIIVMNGLDIPVIVTIDSEGGKDRLEVAARGRVNPTGVSGKATVKVTTKSGELISETESQLGKKQISHCYYVINVMGAAAYMLEDVVYGTGFGTPHVRRGAGEISEQECGVSYAFRDPPNAIAVDRYAPSGENRRWMHYDGDGGWVVAVSSLLDDNGQWASQSRGAAQRIVRAVVTHDPNNPALPAIKERLTAMKLAVPEPTPGNLLAQPSRKRRSTSR